MGKIERRFTGRVTESSSQFDGGRHVLLSVRVEGKDKLEVAYHEEAPASLPLQGVRSGAAVRVTLTIEDVEDE